MDSVGDVGPPVFLRPARGHPPVVPDRRVGEADVLGEQAQRLADCEQFLVARRVGTAVGAHRLDLQACVPELPPDAAHRGDPVPPQLDQLVVALPGHTADHSGHPDTTPTSPGDNTLACRQLALEARHFARSDRLSSAGRAYRPGARSSSTATGRAGSRPIGLRAPRVPGPFAADGRAVDSRDGTADPDRPHRPAL